MEFIILGLILWSAVHFIPSLALPWKKTLIQRLGDKIYKGLFAIAIICSLLFIIYGWRNATTSYLYVLPPMVRHITMLLVLFAFILLGAANRPSRIKGFIRHPMLIGVIVWAAAHLLVNGDTRSIVLFGGMGAWSAIQIILINKREGPWIKPVLPGWLVETRGLIISLLIFITVIFIHPYIAGVALR